MASLAERNRQPELMDQPDLDASLHRGALASLRRINALSRTSRAVWRELAAIAGADDASACRAPTSRAPTRVLDIASGGGDVPIRLALEARRRGLPLEVHGCDISPTAVAYARKAAEQAGLNGVQFHECDVLGDPLPEGYDVVMCSLFLHHLEHSQALALLRNMAAAARRAVLVDDLIRSRTGYLLAWVACRVLNTSPIVRTDGLLSVRAAFTLDEARRLAERAGLAGATFRRHWPQRFLLAWNRP